MESPVNSAPQSDYPTWLAGHWRLLCAIGSRYVADYHDAEDVAAVAAVRLWHVWGRYDPGLDRGKGRDGWAYRVAQRVALDALRRQAVTARRWAAMEAGLASVGRTSALDLDGGDPERVALRRLEGRARLTAVWPRLTALERQTALMLADGDPYPETASRLGIPLPTFKSRVLRLRRHARELAAIAAAAGV